MASCSNHLVLNFPELSKGVRTYMRVFVVGPAMTVYACCYIPSRDPLRSCTARPRMASSATGRYARTATQQTKRRCGAHEGTTSVDFSQNLAPPCSARCRHHPCLMFMNFCARAQRQYRRHAERLVILRALTAMRVSRELKEARAKEVERRFRYIPLTTIHKRFIRGQTIKADRSHLCLFVCCVAKSAMKAL